MTSTSIYTPITPTYLYIKQHSVTKKKYYGKTTRDPYTYNGSGPYWMDHCNIHGKEHIVTLWVSELYYDTSIIDVALKFSADNDIVNSKEWANQKTENGLDGWVPGTKRGPRKKSGKSGKPRSDKGKPRKPLSEEAKVNMRKPHKRKPHKRKPVSEETKDKISAANKGKPQPQVTCPHCGKTGGENVMKRWHFDKCKNI